MVLQGAFSWVNSNQGWKYWSDLHTRLEGGRAVSEPAKSKALRPWAGAHEVPMPCAFRVKGVGRDHRFAAVHADGAGVRMGAHDPHDEFDGEGWPQHTYRELLDGFEVTTDGGKTWSPCGEYES